MSLNLTEIKQIRRFGLIAFLFFGCLWALGFWREKLLPTYLFGFLSVLGLGFILAPSPSRPVYTAWLKIAHFMGRLRVSSSAFSEELRFRLNLIKEHCHTG
jgi:hypothetical protein